MRVGRAFAFVDLSGFTTFTDLHGDEQAGRVLSDFRLAVREVSSRRGVRVAKWLGDGAMLVGVDSRPVVEAVLEMEHKVDRLSSLKLRGGLTEGRVLLFEGDDYVGSAVNLAARLCDGAAPQEILATPELAGALPPWAEACPAGKADVRGFSHPVPLVRLARRPCQGQEVVDPICGMALDREGVATTRGPADAPVAFCSESCADAWDNTQEAAARVRTG